MILFPNAKVNIGLNIVGLRPNGYHDIESVFIPIGLTDALEIALPEGNAPDWSLQTSGNPVAVAPEKNLCIKALRALKEIADIPPVEFHLHKVIPDGAGLGGGSADAAFVLRGLNDLLKLGLPTATLRSVAARIGADCPFFVSGEPAYCTGIGDVAESVDLSRLNGMQIVVVVPDGAVSTAEAYANIPVRQPDVCVKDAVAQEIAEWKGLIRNDFEDYVATRIPDVAHYKETLYRQGALYSQMSGSGSSVFGIFPANATLPGKQCFPNSRCYWSGIISI